MALPSVIIITVSVLHFVKGNVPVIKRDIFSSLLAVSPNNFSISDEFHNLFEVVEDLVIDGCHTEHTENFKSGGISELLSLIIEIISEPSSELLISLQLICHTRNYPFL